MYLINLKFKLDFGHCKFCGIVVEDLDHLFYNCSVIHQFWLDVQIWLQRKGIDINISIFNIKFGIYDGEHNFGLNLILLLCKHYIHKCSF